MTAGLAIVVSVLAGIAIATSDSNAQALLFLVAAVFAGALAFSHLALETKPSNPVIVLLVALSILALAWQGVQGPLSIPVSDFPFLIAMPLIAIALLVRRLPVVLPGWLVAVAGGLAVGALLGALFVPHPPGLVIGFANGASGAAASRETDLGFLLRTLYALVVFPVLLAAVATSWGRVRLFADVWVASTVICALAACLDTLAHVGISNALVSGPFPPDRAVGLTDQPNYLGQFTSMALPVAIVRAYQTKGMARLANLGGIGALIVALQLSGSRLGLLGAVVGVVVLATLVPRVRMGLLVGFLVFVTLGAASLVYQPGGRSALERLSGGDSGAATSTTVRETVLEQSWAIAREHLATGVGFSRILDSHSLPIQFLMAGGLTALAAFFLWVYRMCGLGIGLALGQRGPPAGRELGGALAAALLAWLVPGLANPQLLERFMYVPAGLLLAMGYRLTRSRVVTSPPATTGREMGRKARPAPDRRPAVLHPVGPRPG